MTSSLIDAAPTTAKERPDHAATHQAPTTVVGRSEAFLIACVLAAHPRPTGCVEYLADAAIYDHVERELDAHREHGYHHGWEYRVPRSECALRWEIACRLTVRLYPKLRPLPDYFAAEFTPPAQRG